MSAATVRAVRPPPAELDAEAAVLCAILLDPIRLSEVREILSPDHFYADANRVIFEAMLAVAGRGVPVDALLVASELRARGRIEQIGGAPYLAQLADATPAVANVVEHAKLVRNAGVARIAGDRCTRAAIELRAGTTDAAAAVLELSDSLRSVVDVATPPAQTNQPRPLSVSAVLDGWASAGPLTHEPTGIAGLDALTGGGPVYGTRWYLAGAPDAGKTALLLQLAHKFAERGVAVGLLAVDEDAGDLVTRLAQRLGYMRLDCELREHDTLTALDQALGALPIRCYSDDWTIESAAADLARFAREIAPFGKRPRALLAVDSLQTVTCQAEALAKEVGREMSEVSAVTARVRAIRAVSTTHKLIALVTSELGRASYSSSDPDKQTPTLAAAKWSGAVEYSARVLLGVRSVANETDLVDIEIAKNKHGPRDRHVYVRIDRSSQTLSEVGYAPEPAAPAKDRDSAKKQLTLDDGVIVARALLKTPGMGIRELRAAVRASAGIGHDRADAGLAALGDAVVRGTGPRGARPMTLDLTRLPDAIRGLLQ